MRRPATAGSVAAHNNAANPATTFAPTSPSLRHLRQTTIMAQSPRGRKRNAVNAICGRPNAPSAVRASLRLDLRLGLFRLDRAVGSRRLLGHGDEPQDSRGDLLAVARAIEHAVMTDSPRQVMHLPRVGDVDAKFLGRIGLADPRNVILLAFDGHQGA